MSDFPFSSDNKRYHSYTWELARRFGGKVSRISLSGGFSCPTLDGTKGRGGCTFCAGEEAFPKESIRAQFDAAAKKMQAKWDTPRHIAYFQYHTNTYAAPERLRTLYTEALCCPGVVGLSIATRPDCLPEEVCEVLEEFSKKTYLTVELGLQSVHDKTGERIHRGHSFQDFLEGYEKLERRGILVGAHLINGLPGESAQEMLVSAQTLGKLKLHLVKLHMLYLSRGTELAREYVQYPFPLLSRAQYVNIVCDQLEVLPGEITIGRLTGDGDTKTLLAPEWSQKKLCVLNEIDKELVRRDSWQGKYA